MAAVEVQPCWFHEIAHFSAAARRERSEVHDDGKTVWWKAVDDGVVVGCSGAMLLRGREGRIKGTYVAPAYRGRGISKALNDACLKWCEEQLCSSVSAFVTMERNLSWYLKNGFKVLKEKNGIATCRRVM